MFGMVRQKSDLVAQATEFQSRESEGVLPATFTPGYVDLISRARGARPVPVAGPHGLPAMPATPAGLAGQPQPENGVHTSTQEVQRGFSVGTTKLQLLPYRQNRTYLFIQNNHATQSLYVALSGAPDKLVGVTIPAGGFWEPYRAPNNDIYVIGSGAATSGVVVEGFMNITTHAITPVENVGMQNQAQDFVRTLGLANPHTLPAPLPYGQGNVQMARAGHVQPARIPFQRFAHPFFRPYATPYYRRRRHTIFRT